MDGNRAALFAASDGKDGRIYFGTHGGNFWGLAQLGTKDGYPGSEWMAFDPWYDVKTRQAGDMGPIDNWESVGRSLGIDDRGYVYGTFGKGRIFRYDPRANRTREFGLRLPIREKGISLGRDYDKSEIGWRARLRSSQQGFPSAPAALWPLEPVKPRSSGQTELRSRQKVIGDIYAKDSL
jgi:hypothetical protein